jgi:hypothetical protein
MAPGVHRAHASHAEQPLERPLVIERRPNAGEGDRVVVFVIQAP